MNVCTTTTNKLTFHLKTPVLTADIWQGFERLGLMLFNLRDGSQLIVSHGAADGELQNKDAILQYAHEHPDKKIVLACCWGLSVLLANPELVDLNIPVLTAVDNRSWVVSIPDPWAVECWPEY